MYTTTTNFRFLNRMRQYVDHGYYFYSFGRIPESKDPEFVDRKLIQKHDIRLCRAKRKQRRVEELANVIYLRHQHQFVLMCDEGKHESFFDQEQVFDCRERPILVSTYTVGVKQNRPHIQVISRRMNAIRQAALNIALAPREEIQELFNRNHLHDFSGVVAQKKKICQAVSKKRTAAGLSKISVQDVWKNQRR